MIAVPTHHPERAGLHARPRRSLLVQARRQGVAVGVLAELEILAHLNPDVPWAGHLEADRRLVADVAVIGAVHVIEVNLIAKAEKVLSPVKARMWVAPSRRFWPSRLSLRRLSVLAERKSLSWKRYWKRVEFESFSKR